MNYVKYNRSFIMLEEQNNEFSAKAAPIKGHLKVETGNNKGAIRCAVQNLRHYDKGEYIYKLIFFGAKNEKTLHTVIGTLLVNRQGNGETYFRFQPQNIDGKGNAFHDYSAAIVAAVSTVNERESLHPVLRGAILSDAQPFKYEQKDISAASLEETEIDGMIKEKGEAETEKKEEWAQRPGLGDGVQAASASHNYNVFYNKYVLNACVHTCRMAEFYEDIKPFDTDRTGAVWKKIINVASLPLVSPGAHYFATQYRHFIFGAKEGAEGNISKFYFGIPGRFLNEEQPDAGESGFTYWQPIKGAPPLGEGAAEMSMQAKKNAYGYWIVEIDARTGDIISV